MAVFKDQTLSGDVVLDGNTFRNIQFKDAVLNYEGGQPPRFENCAFDTTSFTFREAAGNTLQFLRAMAPESANMRSVVVGLMPEIQG